MNPQVTAKVMRWGMIAIVAVVCYGCATPLTVRDATPPKDLVDAQAKNIDEVVTIPTAEFQKAVAAGQPAAEVKEAAPTDAAAAPPEEPAYRIGPNDVLAFRSFDDESLSGEIVVRYDGCISLPLVPDIKVSGTTREEAVDAVKKAYGAFFQEPQVSLAILQAKSKTFSVMGEVSMPGEYPYLKPVTLLECINAAGGMRVNVRGGDSMVGSQGQLVKGLIIRHSGDKRDVIECDLRKLTQPGAHAGDTPVFPGDVVYVPENMNLVYVLGEVRNPGVFALSEGMTLMKLLARANSFNESTARMHQIVLTRTVSETDTKIMLINLREIMKTGKDIALMPGDIVYLPRKPMVNLRDYVTRITGTVQPVLSLYTQAWNAYYAKWQWDNIVKNAGADSTATSDLATIQANLKALAALSGL